MFQSIWVYLTQFSRYDHDDGTDGQQTVGRPTDRLTLAIIEYLALEAGQQQEEFSDDLFNNYINRSFFVSRFRSTRFLRQYVMSSHSRDVATTLCPKKVYPLIFDNNFGKCGPIFKILSSPDSWENSLCTHTKTSISSVICCYTTSWQSKIQKCYWFLQHPQQTVDMFLKTLWGVDLTFDSSYTVVSRLLTLTDWLTVWCSSDDVSNQQLNVVQLNVVASWWFSSPWLSSHRLCSFYAVLHVSYTHWSKIISAILLCQVT